MIISAICDNKFMIKSMAQFKAKQDALRARLLEERSQDRRLKRQARVLPELASDISEIKRRLAAIENALDLAARKPSVITPADCPVTIAKYRTWKPEERPDKPKGYTRGNRRDFSDAPVWIAYWEAYERWEEASMKAYREFKNSA
jgi:hypothetical protein